MRPGARWAAVIAAAWAGELLAIAGLAAPAAFATLEPANAGRLVGRIFAQDAYLALALALLLLFIEQRAARQRAESGTGSVMSLAAVLLLGTVFCTVAGYFALQPLLEEARLGRGSWSFGALHAVSGSFYALKTLLVLTLVWRFARD